jgi:hypothetical protein
MKTPISSVVLCHPTKDALLAKILRRCGAYY